MEQGPTQSDPGLCRLCEHRDTPRLESLESKLDARLLSSDYVPSDSEISQLKALLLKEELELARYQDRMVANFQKCRSAISVQRRVPAEIWEIIFRRAFHDYSFIVKHSSFYTPVLVFQTPALVFSQVCARWRAVAIGCSRLWSSIDIHLNAFTPNMTSALQTYLKRSAPQPLSLCIFPGCPPLSANARDAWKLLGPSLSRCETLVWDVRRDDILPEVHGLAFPSLVSFRYTSFPERPKMARAYNWFWRAIRLAP
ncbi:hypothetical protein AAF712_006292 [Marasmius tenuissimus]|uniref:F-box domain-containing protein n=1 Tax=Marasmius tenuissimus TaxID=585030 RepID=A0ABR3A063_9AGAR